MLELLGTALILGVLATITMINLAADRQRALDREAEIHLQLLRQAALYYYNQWDTYPTNLLQTPQALIPFKDNTTSRWAYCYAAGANNWSSPGALLKPEVRSWVIQQDGTIVTGSLKSSHLKDEP